ncbi:hypothetical protein HDK64DRAFT_264530 [Phyllosticta capitalensis]
MGPAPCASLRNSSLTSSFFTLETLILFCPLAIHFLVRSSSATWRYGGCPRARHGPGSEERGDVFKPLPLLSPATARLRLARLSPIPSQRQDIIRHWNNGLNVSRSWLLHAPPWLRRKSSRATAVATTTIRRLAGKSRDSPCCLQKRMAFAVPLSEPAAWVFGLCPPRPRCYADGAREVRGSSPPWSLNLCTTTPTNCRIQKVWAS